MSCFWIITAGAMQARSLLSCSVRLSVCHVRGLRQNERSDTILAFPHRRGWRHSDGNPLTGASNARGYEKSRFSAIIFNNISLYLRNGYSQISTCSEAICKHRIVFLSMQHLAWLRQGVPRGNNKKLSYRWQTAPCWFVQLLRYGRTFCHNM